MWGVHHFLAQLTAIKEIRLDDMTGPGEESKRYAEAIHNVAEHYSIPISPKRLALLNLIIVMVVIYAPRFAAWRLRSATERASGSSEPSPRPVAVPRAAPRPPEPAPPPPPRTAPPGFSMPTPRNKLEENPNFAAYAPSALWNEPAADFPGLG